MHRRAAAVSAPILSLALASCGGTDAPFASASRIERLEDGVGGPKAMARPGDFLLENDHYRVAILGPRNSLGPGLFGGSLVDADLRREMPGVASDEGNDQLAEVFPTVNMNVTLANGEDPDAVSIVADGSDGKAAIVRVTGPAYPFLTLLDALWAIVKAPDFVMTTDYIAEPGAPWVTMRTTASFWATEGATDGTPVQYYDDGLPLIEMAMETGAVFGEFYLQGGSIDVFAPGMGFDEDTEVFEAVKAGQNTFLAPFQFDFLAGVGDGVSYGIAPKEGAMYVPLFTSSQTVAVGGGQIGSDSDPSDAFSRFDPGTTLTYERYFFIGHGDVGSIVDQYVEARNIPYGEVTGHVVERGTGEPVSDARVFVYEPGADRPWSQWTTDVHPNDSAPDGSFAGRLPVGTWEVLVHQQGRKDGQRATLEVKRGEVTAVHLLAAPRGTLSFEVRDERGLLVPAKVTVVREDGPVSRDPVLGDGLIAGDPEAVVFSARGQGDVLLPPGRYRAIASRGLEYEIHTSEPFTVDERTGVDLDLQVIRSVDTPGWVSADLHVHASPSHDSGVSLQNRVTTMVSEGVEFFASTDHDHVTDYAPVVEDLGLEEWVQTAVGNEVTTIEVGHFLSFPLVHDFLGDQGVTQPERIDWTDKIPGLIMSDLRSLGVSSGADPLVFVGHPRDGILGYFDQFGFNPYVGVPGTAGNPGSAIIESPLLAATNPLLAATNFSWEFDAMEILNTKRLDYIRTPTQPEMDEFAAGAGGGTYAWNTRTLAEQADLEGGVYPLGYGHHGVVDDWFALLNLGFKFTALGNSDTHGTTSVESGCPRNYVMSSTDDPMLIDDQEIADAVKAHRVVASYGPFVSFTANGEPIGSEVVGTGPVELAIEVQAPTWVPVERVELYENGSLIREWEVTSRDDEIVRFSETLEVSPAKDSWYVVMVMAEGDLYPVFTPVEMPPIELDAVVTEALVGVEAVANLIEPGIPIPQIHPVMPFALTNPIWVDRDGNGFDAPGFPAWWVEPEDPEG